MRKRIIEEKKNVKIFKLIKLIFPLSCHTMTPENKQSLRFSDSISGYKGDRSLVKSQLKNSITVCKVLAMLLLKTAGILVKRNKKVGKRIDHFPC